MTGLTSMTPAPSPQNQRLRPNSLTWIPPLLSLIAVLGIIPVSKAVEVNQLRRFLVTKVCINCDLKQANLTNAQLNGAVLRGTNLKQANLRGANLSGSILRDVNLKQADLTNANLNGAVLRNVNLDGAILTGTQLPGVRPSPPATPQPNSTTPNPPTPNSPM